VLGFILPCATCWNFYELSSIFIQYWNVKSGLGWDAQSFLTRFVIYLLAVRTTVAYLQALVMELMYFDNIQKLTQRIVQCCFGRKKEYEQASSRSSGASSSPTGASSITIEIGDANNTGTAAHLEGGSFQGENPMRESQFKVEVARKANLVYAQPNS